MDCALVDERDLIAYDGSDYVWVAEQPPWTPALLDELIGSIRDIPSNAELRRELQLQLRGLMLACHDLSSNVHALGEAGQYKRTTATRVELASSAVMFRQLFASTDDRGQQRARIREHAETSSPVTRGYLETYFMQRSDLRRANGMPFTLDCLEELDLPTVIEVVEKARAAISCRPGPAGYPIARGLVDRLYDLCCRATNQRPRRSFGHPRGAKLCASGGVETGWFLTFCRAVLAAIEQGQPYAGVGHRNLAKIVRTVIEERKATQAQATDQTGRDQIF